MPYIENVVIGEPIVSPIGIFSTEYYDWNDNESEKTLFTNERFLPKILVDIGFAPSTSEIRRNRKDLVKELNSLDFIEVKYGKKRCWILVGE